MNEFSTGEVSIQNHKLSVSELFFKTREQQGYTLENVAQHLRISKSYIQAIEQNDVANLPDRVYTLGFVKSYAIFLNLDPTECCQRFKSEVLGEQPPDPILNFPTMLTLDSSPSHMILKISLGIVALVIIAGIFIWQYKVTNEVTLDRKLDVSETSEKSSSQIPVTTSDKEEIKLEDSVKNQSFPRAVPNAARMEDKNQSSVGNSQDPSTLPRLLENNTNLNSKISETSMTQHHAQNIQFSFIQECWVKIQDAAQHVLVEKTFQTGEHYLLPVRNNYTLHTGNAGGIEISGPDMPSKILGNKGQVIENLSLDSRTLSAYLNQQ